MRTMHQARGIAESFGDDAARYDRARPCYPDELIARIVAAAPGPSLLDVGIGTGIDARQLVAAGCDVLGVDPDDRMASVARAHGLPVEIASFEQWDAGGRSFDGVVSAQAWHWVDPVAGARKAAEVLPHGGLFAAFWNVADIPLQAAAAFAAVYERVAPGSLGAGAYRRSGSMIDGYGAILDKAAHGLGAAGGFARPDRWRFDWDHHYSRDEWLDVLATQGGNTSMPTEQLHALLSETGEAVDALGGGLTTHYGTLALVARRER